MELLLFVAGCLVLFAQYHFPLYASPIVFALAVSGSMYLDGYFIVGREYFAKHIGRGAVVVVTTFILAFIIGAMFSGNGGGYGGWKYDVY